MNQEYNLRNYTMTFGKFKGKTLAYICVSEVSYLIWLYNQNFVDGELRDYLSYNIDEINADETAVDQIISEITFKSEIGRLEQ